MRPPDRFKWLRIIAFTIPILLFLVLFVVLLIPCILPFTLIFYSANRSLKRKDWPIVQRYISHFEALHPDLAMRISRFYAARQGGRNEATHSINFWPMLTRQHDIEGIPLVLMVHTTEYTFSAITGLFWNLESVGFSRRALYDFLRQEVESKVPDVTEEERAEFRRVTDRVCNYDLFHYFSRLFLIFSRTSGEGFTLPQDVPTEKIVCVRDGSLDWIVNESASLIVPMDWPSDRKLFNLSGRFPLWRSIKKDADLANWDGDKAIDLR